MDAGAWRTQFDTERIARLHGLAQPSDPLRVTAIEEPSIRTRVSRIEVLITGPGAQRITAPVLHRMPDLRAIVHCGAGARGLISLAVWDRQIAVCITDTADAALDELERLARRRPLNHRARPADLGPGDLSPAAAAAQRTPTRQLFTGFRGVSLRK